MCDFWETVLFRAGLYHGNALLVHRQLDSRHPLCANHFARWLTLWNATLDEMYRGPVAERAKVQAGRIAQSMHRRLRGIDATEPIPIGTTQVRMEFAYDGGGMGKGGDVTLYCDGKEVGNGRVDRTQGVIFSADETTDVGRETGTTVSPDYTAHTSKFSGKFTGCRSIWARTLPTPTTTSRRRNASGLRWRDSRSALQ